MVSSSVDDRVPSADPLVRFPRSVASVSKDHTTDLAALRSLSDGSP